MSPVTIPAVEWFFGQREAALADMYNGLWSVRVITDGGDREYFGSGPYPIELIEAAYEKLYAEPARREIREEEK